MYVLNDVRRDSRVIREARTLVAAGHAVTILGRAGREEVEATASQDGFEVVRLPLPTSRPLWFTWLTRPWRLWRRAGRDLRAGPRRWPRAALVGAVSFVTLPWTFARWAWLRATGERSDGRLDYIGRWRLSLLPWAKAAAAAAPAAEVHHAHDLDTLAAAMMAARRDGARLIYDAHEVYLAWGANVRQPRIVRWVMARWERRLAGAATALVTVNDACAAELDRRIGPLPIVVVHNCPPRWTPPGDAGEPSGPLRAAVGLDGGVAVVLCHGGFQADRGLEQTAEAMTRSALRDAHLVLLGYTVHAANPIAERIAADPRLGGRVHLLPPVSPDELLEWVAGADVDVMVLQPVDLNHRLSTPNKLFESLAAGVPVVSSDFAVRRRIVLDDPDGPLGAVCDPTDPDAIAASIASILDLDPDARRDLRRRCLRAAHERWNWETEGARLVELYRSFGGV